MPMAATISPFVGPIPFMIVKQDELEIDTRDGYC